MKKTNAFITIGFILAALAAAGFMVGCGNGEPATQSGKQLRIAVIPKGTAHVFWQSVNAGAKTAGEELGVDILWKGPETETQKSVQINIVQDFIVKQVDGIVLAPLDMDALVGPVETASQAGIPVVIFDSGINTDQYISYVATDNYKGGETAARELGRLLNGKGTVIIIKVDPASESTTQREKGFEDVLKNEFPGITILDSQYGYSAREKSRQVTEDLLSRYPDVDAFFGPNESSTFGILLALQARGLAGKKIFVGFDSSEELVEALRKREINALVLQNPFKMGYEGVNTIVKYIHGEEVEKRIDTGVYLITPDTMDQPENMNLLKPDLSILQGG